MYIVSLYSEQPLKILNLYFQKHHKYLNIKFSCGHVVYLVLIKNKVSTFKKLGLLFDSNIEFVIKGLKTP